MRRLLPEPAPEVDLADAYAVPRGDDGGRPFVRCNMISSLDGAISVAGRSGMLGGVADRHVFSALRSLADVVLVGAGTARAESYGPVRLDERLRQARTARGRPPVPPIAVVTASGNLDWSSPFFTEAEVRPLVVTTAAFDAAAGGGEVADVVVAGSERVEPAAALEGLRRLGHRSVLLEGGPALNADVARAGLLDELCLTVSPRLVAGTGRRVLAGPELAPPLAGHLVALLEDDGFLFYRLAVQPPPGVGR
ncbi:MAG: pyrimidine reductase family protein [Acidimicrobiales bacterium]